jgi:hypothetical protein
MGIFSKGAQRYDVFWEKQDFYTLCVITAQPITAKRMTLRDDLLRRMTPKVMTNIP